MDTFVDGMFLISIGLFITGVLALFIKQIRINGKTRYYFIGSLLVFSLTLAIGWESAVEAFREGYEEGRACCDESAAVSDSLDSAGLIDETR
jgi:hypothetical protein